jgi:MFS family permease
MLGFGWNLLFLAGTVLLPRSYKPRERFKVQGIHDFMVFGGQAVAALSAGALLALLGWQGLMQVSAIFIVLHVAILLTQYLRLRGISNATS